jgi:hypothetical protein
MTSKDSQTGKRPRLTEEQIAKIKRLHKQGVSQTEIARQLKCHRQTVRLHLVEKKVDTIAERARSEVLADALRQHFQQLKDFAGSSFKMRLDASVAESPRRKPRRSRDTAPIVVSGMMALPSEWSATYMAEEWMRMYMPSSKEAQLLNSLRDHTKDFTLWAYWDQWRKKVANYEISASELLQWVDEKLEEGIPKITPDRLEPARNWIFGNILGTAAGAECEDIRGFRNNVLDEEGVIIAREPGIDRDGSEALYRKLINLIEEAKIKDGWVKLESATKELLDSGTQSELRRLAKKLDDSLAGIELMLAFPGHCNLCPV